MKKISIAALFAALTFVVTYITGFIRTPLPGGYLNVGDAVIFISGILFGPSVGFVAGSIGSSLSDLLYGSVNFAPGTFVIKGIEGLLVGLIFNSLKERKNILSILISVIGIIAISFSFFAFQQPNLTSDNINSLYAFSIIGFSFLILGVVGGFVNKFRNDILAIYSMIVGGIEMVLGYYLYETFILQYAALLEVPLNALQAAVSVVVAFIILKALRRTS